MKFNIFSFIIMLCFAGSAFSQDSRFGVKGGLNLSNLYTNDAQKENIRVGFHGGVFAKLALPGPLAIQPEVLYSTRGACLEYHNEQITGMANFNLNYVDIPLLLVINLTKRYSIHAGPYFSILTNINLENETKGSEFFDFENELDRDNFKTTDYGLAGGIGADFNKIGFGARYSYGLQQIGKDKAILGEQHHFPDAKHSLIQVYLSLSFF